MKKIKIFFPIIVFLFVIIILWRGLFLHPAQIPSPLVNKTAPALSDEKFLGNITLVNVFASWCSACQEEHAFFQELAKKKYLTLYGLDYKDDPSAAKKYLKRNGNPYQKVISDEKGDVAINWGVYGTPETFLIDKKGIVRYKQIGPLTQDVWEKTLQPLVEKIRKEV